jgi:hypothetical protein
MLLDIRACAIAALLASCLGSGSAFAADCPVDPDGTPCHDADPCTTSETCQGGSCVTPPGDPTPAPPAHVTTTGATSSLKWKDKPNDEADMVKWMLGKGPGPVTMEHLRPGGIQDQFCFQIWDQVDTVPRLVFQAVLPSNHMEGDALAWTQFQKDGGLRFGDRSKAIKGVKRAYVRTGVGKAQAGAHAVGVNIEETMPPPTIALLQGTVVAQLSGNSGFTAQSTFGPGAVKKSSLGEYSAKTP